MRLSLRVDGRSFRFRDLNDLLAKANRERSGDRLAGLAARSAQERVAARRLLAEVTLAELRARPALPPEHDAVSRVVEEGLDETVYRRVRGLTAGELRDHVLGAAPSELTAERLGDGLTPEMAAAVAKLCSNLDLVAGAARIPVVTRANTTLGLPGRLGVRLQPNHPTDDVAEILAQTAEGLAWGCGDAVIGVNPARDDEEVVRRLLLALDGLVRKHRVPTQTCVLAHVTTQMRVLDGGGRGARRGGSEQVPMGLMFQSLAGTQSACRAFGIDVALLDEAAAMARDRCNVKGPHVMYFETGQGSELSSGCHEGIDQVTLEARCYGLARRYAPFLVNTVVGFIGPEYLYDASEVQRAGLEDHFMGKLLGLPMGVDACATNHMRGDHDDLENQALLLAAAGANYVMGVPMGDDVLLGYRSTSFHDAAALRETLGRRPAPEFERWMEGQGLMRNGRLTARAGDGRRFGLPARRRTRFLARIAVGRAGTRPPLDAALEFAADLAAARDAVHEPLPGGLARRLHATLVRSDADDDEEFLRNPAAGRRLAAGEAARVRGGAPARGRGEILPVVLSGLSAGAVADQAGPVLVALRRELGRHGLRLARPVLVERGRLKLADEIARLRGATVLVALIGDRPGLRTPRSMSAYVTARPTARTTDAGRRMVSNIHARGLSPAAAARQIAGLIVEGLPAARKASARR